MKTTTAAAALLGGLSFAATAMSSGRLQAGDEWRFGALRAPKARGEKAQRAALRSKRPHNREPASAILMPATVSPPYW